VTVSSKRQNPTVPAIPNTRDPARSARTERETAPDDGTRLAQRVHGRFREGIDRRPLAIDLFCCAGGASMGLHRAGFDVVGVDIAPQPRYPFRFIQGDALRPPVRLDDFDLIWASPPCQAHTSISLRWRGKGGLRDERADLIPATRELLRSSGVPYVIENVPGARNSLEAAFTLTGEMFSLRVHRPRLFEASFLVMTPERPARQSEPIAVYGKMDGRRLWTRADGSELRACKSLEPAAAAMGIDWMEWPELKESIPPAYSEFIGKAALAAMTTPPPEGAP